MKKRGGDIFKSLGLLMQLGFSMAFSILIGVIGGAWLDRRLGTTPWLLLVGAVIGSGASFKIMYDVATRASKKEQQSPEEDDNDEADPPDKND